MTTAAEHYSSLLARHYTWMFGTSFDEKTSEQQAILSKVLASSSVNHGLAVDLGSGPGFQAFALADLGFSPVLAVDTSPELLAELESHLKTRPIRSVHSDIRDISKLIAAGTVDVIVCMGDTITHLPARSDVLQLFTSVFTALAPGGIFVLSWRDLTHELAGTERFIPVRSDDEKIMTCFLDYISSDTVLVHDLVYERQPEGWTLHKSSYPKLRLSADWLADSLLRAGFSVNPATTAGRLQLLAAVKP